MALGKLPAPRRPTFWMIVGQGPIALAEGAGGGCLDILTRLSLFSPLTPSLWETAQYRLKYWLVGCFGFNGPLRQYFSLYQAVSQREGGGGGVVRRCWVNFQCRGVLLIWIIVGQGPIALAVGAGGGVWTFFLSSIISLFFLPLSGRRPDIY